MRAHGVGALESASLLIFVDMAMGSYIYTNMGGAMALVIENYADTGINISVNLMFNYS